MDPLPVFSLAARMEGIIEVAQAIEALLDKVWFNPTPSHTLKIFNPF